MSEKSKANQSQSVVKSKTIYVLRHGQTDYNLKGMVQGRGVDAELNATGRKQAQQAYAALSSVGFETIYTSCLKRTHQTIAPFLKDGKSFTQLPGLDEISWGSQEGVVATKEEKNLYAQTLKDWERGELHKSVGGGESPLEVMARQKEAMEVILSSEAQTILICMHGRAMRILLAWVLNHPLSVMDGFPHQNCCYYTLQYTNGVFSISDFNKVEHLIESEKVY